jgi:hypothetical protein
MKSLFVSCPLLAVTISLFAATPQFSPRQDISTGFRLLYGMAVADFNGDGKPDIAATDNYLKKVFIYLNDGEGSFATSKSVDLNMAALGPGQIITGDFNEDGKQDLIIATVSGVQSDLLLTGNGDGTFTQRTDLPNSYGFYSAVPVDINRDQHLDLVLGGNGINSLYIGDGRGSFQTQPFTSQGNAGLTTGITASDFNQDGKVDFVVALPIPSGSVRTFLGNGDGTFSAPINLSSNLVNAQPSSLATADFDGDGIPDLLLGANFVGAIFLGKGDGSFDGSKPHYLATPGTSVNQGSYGSLVAAADIDADKKIDAVIADDNSKTINVLLNDGTGTFSQSTPDFSGAIDHGVAKMAVADLNGDGFPDIVIANNVTQNISIFLSIGPKTLPEITVSPSSPFAVVGSSIGVTVKVAGSNGIVPTGSVTLMDDSTSLGQQTLDANGQAVFTLPNLAAGYHTFSSVYAGDINYYSQTSILVGQAITDLKIVSPTPSQTITAGATASYSLTVVPVGGFAGTITLTCSELPSFATCDPVTVTILDKQTASATLTVKTVAPVRSQNSTSRYAFALLPLFAVCCIRRRRLLSPLLGITLICSLGFFATGCSSSKPSTSTPGTPSGSSTFTITASGSFLGQTLTRTTAATLVVQ